VATTALFVRGTVWAADGEAKPTTIRAMAVMNASTVIVHEAALQRSAGFELSAIGVILPGERSYRRASGS
jgi:hypothetical protein